MYIQAGGDVNMYILTGFSPIKLSMALYAIGILIF